MNIDAQVATFIAEMGDIPLLTPEQEREYAITIQKYKDGKARAAAIDKFVKGNLRLVLKEAFKVANRTGLDVKDLIGYGCVGLMRAIYKYDPTMGTKFSTYATPWINQGMRDFMYKNTNPVQIPIHVIDGLSKHRKMLDAEGNAKPDAEVMQELNINESFLKRIKKAYVTSVSLDEEIKPSEGTHSVSGARTFEESIPDENAPDPSMETENNDKYNDLYTVMGELDEMSREIVTAQFLESDKVQLHRLGKKYGVTGERIRQIKAKALKVLRKKLERKQKWGK